MLTDATRDTIQRWVAARFDLAPTDMPAEGVVVKAHGPALADYHGVYTWLMAGAAIVSAPAEVADHVRRSVAGQPPATLGDAAFWRAALGERVERIVGPSYQGFLDATAFQPADAQGARPLTPADQPALARFIADCPPAAWADSAIVPDHTPIFGLERDGALIALASAPLDGRPDDPTMRSVGVVTLPAWRGQGAGRAVVSALTAHCLADGATLHYQTLRANVASVAIAHALGYADVATALAVRLNGLA